MSGATRGGGIPGPESRTGLVRPAWTEAEFERRQAAAVATPIDGVEPGPAIEPDPGIRNNGAARARTTRAKTAKPKRVQRMFALEEELDKKLWLYDIHIYNDSTEVYNVLLRPL